VVSERIDLAALVRGLGSEWHIAQNYFKLHACCRYNHGTLDAVDAIAAGPGLPDVDQIERIEVATYNIASELIDPAPRNTLAAKFSVPFAVATRLVHGHSQLPSFTWEAVRNPAVLALAQKVVVREDKAMSTQECARQIIYGMVRRRREVVMTAQGKIARFIKLLLPGVVEKLALAAVKKEFQPKAH
jgi:2-methylcitrate dehydratase PrpD